MLHVIDFYASLAGLIVVPSTLGTELGGGLFLMRTVLAAWAGTGMARPCFASTPRGVFNSPAQANALKQVVESWIGAQRVKAWPHEDPRAKALGISFFEPGHCLILIVQSYVDHGDLRSV